jgi:CheY-like chemotaxis protein/predicted RNase H-like HicB family nuclease
MSAVLLVEDRDNVRLALRSTLTERGLKVIEASGKEDAISLFRRNAGIISGAITDLRLVDDADENDVSGVEVGRMLKQHIPDLPVYCNTAYDIDRHHIEDSPFDQVFRKSDPSPEKNIASNFDSIQKALEIFDSSRFEKIPEQLQRIKSKYSITDEDFLHLVSVSPISSKIKTALTLAHELAEGGDIEDYATGTSQLVVLEDGMELGTGLVLKQALPVVHKVSEGIHIVEVFGVPTIYAYGDDYAEAVEGLLESLVTYRQELLEETQPNNADFLIRFQLFLSEVIGEL